MKKSVLALLIAAASTSAYANTAPDNIVRTGTCGGITEECRSVGINVANGEVYQATDSGNKDIWDENNRTVVAEFVMKSEVTNIINQSIQEGDIIVNNENGFTTDDSALDESTGKGWVNTEFGDDTIGFGHDGVITLTDADGGVTKVDVTLGVQEKVNDVKNSVTQLATEIYGAPENSGVAQVIENLADVSEADGVVNYVKQEDEKLNTKIDNTVDVLTDGEGNSYGAIIRDESGNEIEVLDRQATDNIIVDNINQQTAINSNYDRITTVEEVNAAQQEQLDTATIRSDAALENSIENHNKINAEIDARKKNDERIEAKADGNTAAIAELDERKVDRNEYEADQLRQDEATQAALDTAVVAQEWVVQLGEESRAEDARLDSEIDSMHELSVERDEALAEGLVDVNDASVDRDKQLAADIAAGDKATLNAANKYTDQSVATSQKANEKARAEIVATQAKVDTAQDQANQQAREEMAVEQAKVDNLQNKQIQTQGQTIVQNQGRLTAVEGSVDELYAQTGRNTQAIKELDGRVSNLEQKVEEQGSFIAGIGAQAAIPQAQLYPGETALGMGAYTDAHNNDAVALQFQTMPSEKVRVNVGLSAAPEDFSNTWQASVGGVYKF